MRKSNRIISPGSDENNVKKPPSSDLFGGGIPLDSPWKKSPHSLGTPHLAKASPASQGFSGVPGWSHHHPTLLPIDPRKGVFPVTLKKPFKGLPSRKFFHIPPGEREIIFKMELFRGYVIVPRRVRKFRVIQEVKNSKKLDGFHSNSYPSLDVPGRKWMDHWWSDQWVISLP